MLLRALIVKNTRSDFRGLRNFISWEGHEELRILLKQPFEIPQMMFDVPAPFSLSYTFGIKSTF